MEFISAENVILLVPFETNLHYMWCKFSILIKHTNSKNGGITAFNGAIWDEFNEQHLHQSTIQAPYSMPNLLFFCAN